MRELTRAYERLGLVGQRVLLAVSGGADSTALLLGTHEVADALGLSLEVATFDHGVRPEAAEEVAQVAALCGALGVGCHPRRLDLRSGAGFEARARTARYQALEALRSERGLVAVATAHTASDQAETLLMRLARGASVKGARGIHRRRGALVRPLLFATRAEVEAFLEAWGGRCALDPMNDDPTFFRVRVRRSVLPALEQAAGGGVAQRLARFAHSAADDEALLGALAEDAAGRLAVSGGLDAVGLWALPPALRTRVLARTLERAQVEPSYELLEQALEALLRRGKTQLPGGASFSAEGGLVRCVPRREGGAGAAVVQRLTLDGPELEDGEAGLAFRLTSAPVLGELTLAVLARPGTTLELRRRQPGDRVCGPPRRKLQDVLTDARVPREVRDLLPVVSTGEGEVLWVVGVWPSATRGPRVGAWFLSARPLGEERARDWLVRYKLRAAAPNVAAGLRGPK